MPLDLTIGLNLLDFLLDILPHFKGVRFETNHASCEPEIANLDVAVFIYQDVRWLDVTVKNLGRVDVV